MRNYMLKIGASRMLLSACNVVSESRIKYKY